MNNKYWFFGSKLNTALLLVLIILMIIALHFMSRNKDMYLNAVGIHPEAAEYQQNQMKHYSTKGVSFDYAEQAIPGVPIKNFATGISQIDIRVTSTDSIDITYAEVNTDGARSINFCFEAPIKIVTINGIEFSKCYSQADPYVTYSGHSGNYIFYVTIPNSLEEKNILSLSSITIDPGNANQASAQPNTTEIVAKIKVKDHGPLTRCTLNNSTYFFAHGSAFDGYDYIYDSNGDRIANCGGGEGPKPNPYPQICTQMKSADCSPVQ
jgi:hypothetical protein